jgi:nucleoside-diphosphate-sugar epimerase
MEKDLVSSFELSKSRCLISGTSSGVGRFLSKQLPFAKRYDRSSNILDFKDKSFDVIFHCAYDKSYALGHKNLFEQLKSNIQLVEELCNINHKVFIFFSSIEIYSKEFNGKLSDHKLGSGDLFSKHGFFKIIGESIVASKAKNFIILRPSLMIGEDSRINTLMNIVRGNKGPFTLGKNSEFNLITHDQVWSFLQAVLAQEMRGVFNLCSGLNLSLDEVAQEVKNYNISWGDYNYKTPKIDDSNIIKLFGLTEYKIEDIVSNVLSWK